MSSDLWATARSVGIELGARVRKMRDDNGWSLFDLQALLVPVKVDPPELSRIERGMMLPSPDVAAVLSQMLLQRDLGDVVPIARPSDPDTSHDAAKSVTPETMRTLHKWWLNHLAFYRGRDMGQLDIDDTPIGYYCTDEGAFTQCTVHPRSASGFRTRRSELVRSGMVEATDIKVPISTGRHATVWRLTDFGLEALKEQA